MRPDELEKALAPTGMTIIDRTGVVYHPLADRWQRSKDMDVNYMVLAERPAPADAAGGSGATFLQDRALGACHEIDRIVRSTAHPHGDRGWS